MFILLSSVILFLRYAQKFAIYKTIFKTLATKRPLQEFKKKFVHE